MIIFLSLLLILYFTYLIWQRWRQFQLREELGLKGPKTNFIFGNMHHFIQKNKKYGYDDGYLDLLKWHTDYGKTFGLYLGPKLQIISNDEEFAKEVFIKQFSKFGDRCVPEVFWQNELRTALVQMAKSSGWKEVRSCMSPQFSTGKMRMMYETIEDKIQTFMRIIEKRVEAGSAFNIYDDFQALTMDVIGKCAFAIESNCQLDRNEIFYQNAKQVFREIDLNENIIVPASVFLPEFSWLWKWLYPMSGMARVEKILIDGLSQVYDARKNGQHTDSMDILQLLLNKADTAGNGLTKEQVVSNCYAFLLAGYETTSTALGYSAYLLAKHPQVQEKLYQEIIATKQQKGLTFEAIHDMPYLDAVFKESLRIYPPVINFTSRECLEDTVVTGVHIPKGTWVFTPVYSMHHDENKYSNAEEFYPERFLEEDSKDFALKWMPFGLGPRNCVGMRFAEMEFKMVLVKLVQLYKLKTCKGQEDLIRIVMGIIMQPKDGKIILELSKR
ncbi:unnamed protein product [Auanema sp. JU1783]|nr:unnamed protein product [Auanema sp. JU1783]